MTIREGQILPCNGKKVGRNANGREYMLFQVWAEKGFDKMTVFAANVEDVKDSVIVKVKKIETVSIVTKKTSQGKWLKDVNVYCILEPQENPNRTYDQFMGGPDAEKEFAKGGGDEDQDFSFFSF